MNKYLVASSLEMKAAFCVNYFVFNLFKVNICPANTQKAKIRTYRKYEQNQVNCENKNLCIMMQSKDRKAMKNTA